MEKIWLFIIVVPVFIFFIWPILLMLFSDPKTIFRNEEGDIIVKAGDKISWQERGIEYRGFIEKIEGDFAIVAIYKPVNSSRQRGLKL
jgi:hypothetical protein